MGKEKVLVVVVDYNTADLVPGVIASIDEDAIDVTLLIVDNGSSSESFEKLQAITDPRVHLIRSEKNLGFAGGNNFGIRYAVKNLHGYKYVFLLNPDAYINKNLIGGLKSILDANPRAACISPKIFDKDGGVWYRGASFDFKRGRVTSQLNLEGDVPKPAYEVDVFNGCAVLFRMDRFMEVGLLNEELFMYYEEADCSLRLRKLGYTILYAPGFTVLHYVSFSTRNYSHIKTYYLTRNKFRTFNNTMTMTSKLRYLVHETASLIKSKKYKNAGYLLKGYVDFLKGKKGQIGTAA